MNDRQTVVDQNVAEISTGLATLEGDRRRMFLNWLQAHHKEAVPITDASIKDRLITWFEELTEEGILCEYRLILSEIAWWRDLDDGLLAEIVATG